MNVYWLEQVETDVPPETDWLSSNEKTRLSGLRFAKRRTDWRLGRWTAKRSLAAYLGTPSRPDLLARIEIRATSSGAPEVLLENEPLPLTISISHRAGRSLCAIAPSGAAMGCDLELVEPRSDAFIADYFASDEQSLVARAAANARPKLLAVLWSAKESALKALRTGLRLDTRCVVVSLTNPTLQEREEGLVQDGKFDSAPLLETPQWQGLQVRASTGHIFQGYWQASGPFVRTMLATPAPALPIALDVWADKKLPRKEANDEGKTPTFA